MSDKLGWRPGYTHGISEGKWTREESTKMRYERANPQHYDSPASESYRENYERIFGKRKAMDLRVGQKWSTHATDCPGGTWMTVTINRIESDAVHFSYCDYTGRDREMFAGKDTLTAEEFRARYPFFREQVWEEDEWERIFGRRVERTREEIAAMHPPPDGEVHETLFAIDNKTAPLKSAHGLGCKVVGNSGSLTGWRWDCEASCPTTSTDS